MNDEVESILREHLVETNLALLFALVLKSLNPTERQRIIQENKQRGFDQPLEGVDPALASMIPDAWQRVNGGFWQKIEDAFRAASP
jgi:hypothetical protein